MLTDFGTHPADRVPKAELHAHLEGTIHPPVLRMLAERNGIALPDGDFGLPDGLHFRLDYAYNFHQMQFTLEDYTAAVYEGLNALKLGVGGQF